MAIAEGPVVRLAWVSDDIAATGVPCVELARVGPAMQPFYDDVRARSEARDA
jgi:hypothetical protein